ncbi:MAG: MBL fold metallo-hydrolase, partial [Bacteroidetes bacterium]|nr:MBL fold metallo-hydrolase [Bacteroidota bacterium]
KGTLGHRLLRGDPVVYIKDRELSVYATIRQTDVLSAHGDHDDLLNVARQQDKDQIRTIFLVHGEEASMQALADSLEEEGYPVSVPEKDVSYNL